MENFTIHIFGYGETQINSKDLSIKVKTDTLTKVTPLVAGIFAKKPAENPTLITDFHAINIFNYKDIRWMAKDGFDVKDDEESLKTLIDSLITELQFVKDNPPVITPKETKLV
jgi:hypothetical protein